MFNIKKIKGAFVTKSVIPTNTRTEINTLAKARERIAELENQSPTNAHEELLAKNKADIEAMNSIREKMKAMKPAVEVKPDDLAALSTHAAYKVEKGYTTRKPGVVVLPTGCPNCRIRDAIGAENTARMDAGLQPILSYQSWIDQPAKDIEQNTADEIARGFVFSNDAGESKNISKNVATYLVKQKYYLLRDSGISYVWNTDSKIGVVRLVKDGSQFGGNNSNTISGDIKQRPFQNLSDAEHAELIKSQPSYEDLMSVYAQAQNNDNLQINVKTATSVW